MQDIPRTADHAPSKTIFTWKIDLEGIYEQLGADMMKGVCNLGDRLDAELNKRPQVIPQTLNPLFSLFTIAEHSFGSHAATC